MLGDRDSEMAIRIEDTEHKAIRMNGQPFYVGALPHKLRTSLMKRHLGDSSLGKQYFDNMQYRTCVYFPILCFHFSLDVSDPTCVGTYYNLMVRTAVQNSNIYSVLDGPLAAFDKAYTLSQYNDGILEARALQASDENVKILLESITGHIVMYPLDFLKLENLGPSMASKTVVPTDLWV